MKRVGTRSAPGAIERGRADGREREREKGGS